MATRDELYTALRNADAAGDSDSVQKLGAYLKTLPPDDGSTFAQRVSLQQAKDRDTYSPISGNVSNAIAGYGSAIPRMLRGLGQRVGEGIDAVTPSAVSLSDLVTGGKGKTVSSRLGLPQQSDVDEANHLDAPLLATKAGAGGNLLGTIAALAPTVAIPGAGSLLGAGAIGAVTGAITPTSTSDGPNAVARNVAIGGAAGSGGVLLGRVGAAAYGGVKALAEPFYEAGRQRIAGRVLQRFADDPSAIANTTNTPTVTGALPTLAEQTGDAGLARLQDSLRSLDPQIENQIGGRLSANNASRVSALRGLAGEDGARDAAVGARQTAAQQQYGAAFNGSPPLTPGQTTTLEALASSPAMQDALNAAKTNAANAGKKFDPTSVEGLHNTKLALDDMIADPATAGQAAKANAIKTARDKLTALIGDISPDYQAARSTYAQMSQPVNSFDIAAQVAKKGLSNGSDLSGTPTINRNALLGALKDEPALIKQATGRKVGNALSDVMQPEDLNLLRSIASEADRTGAVATAGNGPGAASAQRMASQNILQQVIGPTGLPKSWAESVLANTVVGKPFNLIYGGVAEPKIQQALAAAVLDPVKAKAMLAAAAPAERSKLLEFFQRSAAARAVPGALTSPTAQSIANRLQQ